MPCWWTGRYRNNDRQISEQQRHFHDLRMRIKRLEDANMQRLSPYKSNDHEHQSLVSDSLRHDTEMDKVRRREQYWYDMQHFQQFEEANKRARRRKRKSSPRDDFNFGKRKFDENRRFSH